MRITEIYQTTEYLKATDLQKPAKVTISDATLKTFRDQKTGESVRKIVLRFERARKVFVLNLTQARAVAFALGTDETDQWIGKDIVLSAGVAHNGQPTIQVSAAVEAASGDNPFT